MYIPKIKYVYPEKTDEQIIHVNQTRKVKLNGSYYDALKKITFKIAQFFYRIVFYLVAVPLVKLRYHVKVEGRKEFNRHKKFLKKYGFITVSNHVFLWDFPTLCVCMKMGFPNVPAWGKIVSSKFGKVFSLAGVVPIPEDKSLFRNFYGFIDGVFKENKWVHIYPETGLWYYYVPIRPFKRGAAYFACQYNKPIVPVGYSFRERKGISRLWNKKDPFVTAHIGEPIMPDLTLDKREAAEKLNKQIRDKIIEMVGIKSEEENERMMKELYTYENGHYYTEL